MNNMGDRIRDLRIQKGYTMEELGEIIGVQKSAVNKWEKGTSSPTFFQSLEWFRACGINPFPHYLELVFPDMFSDADEDIDDNIKNFLEQLPISTKKALLFLFKGEHGSAPSAIVQLMLAYLHTPLTSRATQAIVSANMYTLEKELGNDPCPSDIQPNIELLESAIKDARAKIYKDKYGKKRQNRGNRT